MKLFIPKAYPELEPEPHHDNIPIFVNISIPKPQNHLVDTTKTQAIVTNNTSPTVQFNTLDKGQICNVLTFKIIIISCATKIISCEKNQLNFW